MHVTMGEIARIMHEVCRAAMLSEDMSPYDELTQDRKAQLVNAASAHMANPDAEVDPDDRSAMMMQAIARAVTAANK